MTDKNSFKGTSFLALLLGAGLAYAADAPPGDASTQKLEQQVNQMRQQLEALKVELNQVKAQSQAASPLANFSFGGYGEANYNHPTRKGDETTADLRRAVLEFGYRFDDRTVFNSEYEIEHAIASADDAGEIEVEQFYVDHRLGSWGGIKGGLFLMPFGLLNEHHEPTAFFGVERNFVESLIIASTWREGGFGVHGATEAGLAWDAGLTTGLDLSKWDVTATPGLGDQGPMKETHQELSQARAQHLAQYVSLNYNGIPGLLAGAAVFSGNMAKFDPSLGNERMTLWEAHARWTPGAADLSALYARGSIGNTAEANALNPGASNPIPAVFYGYYLQGGYSVWQHDSYRLAPFLRWERLNTASRYEGVPQGLGPGPRPTERIWTYGLNFQVTPNIVLKADFQDFKANNDLDRFDVGIGLSY